MQQKLKREMGNKTETKMGYEKEITRKEVKEAEITEQ